MARTILAVVLMLALVIPAATLAQDGSALTLEVILSVDAFDPDVMRDLPAALQHKLDDEGITTTVVEWTDSDDLRVVIDMRTVRDPLGLFALLEGPVSILAPITAEAGLPVLEFVDFSMIASGQIPEGARILTTAQMAALEAALDAGEAPPFEDYECSEAVVCQPDGAPFVTVMPGAGIGSAAAVENQFAGWMVQFSLDMETDGAQAFIEYVANHANRPLAIMLNGRLLSYPTIQPDLANAARAGNMDGGVITGNFTRDEAETLAATLESSGHREVWLTVKRFEYSLP